MGTKRLFVIRFAYRTVDAMARQNSVQLDEFVFHYLLFTTRRAGSQQLVSLFIQAAREGTFFRQERAMSNQNNGHWPA